MAIILQEEGLGLISKKPSYRPTGTHPSPDLPRYEDRPSDQLHCH